MGNGELSLPEQRAHFALWALMKAPLLVGTDLRTASQDVKGILLAEEVGSGRRDLRRSLDVIRFVTLCCSLSYGAVPMVLWD